MADPTGEATPVTRSGFVGLAGRPNVGKSTLVNAIVGSTIAIATSRPQTTRRAIRGVATDEARGRQLVMVDLPGVQRPRDTLTGRMQKTVERSLSDADVVLFVLNGEEGIGAGDRFIANSLLASGVKVPIICAVNKADRLGRNIIPVLAEAGAMKGITEVFPISALTGEGVPELADHLGSLMPESPFLYPTGDTTDQPVGQLVAELIRSQALMRTRDEIPHSLEVKTVSMRTREDGLVEMRDRPAQRHVVLEQIGKLRRGPAGRGVAPGAERHELVPILVEGQISVHHRRDADGRETGRTHAIPELGVRAGRRVCLLHPLPDRIQRVRPGLVDVLVLPAGATRGQRDLVVADDDRLDPGGAQLDAEDTLAAADEFRRLLAAVHAALLYFR